MRRKAAILTSFPLTMVGGIERYNFYLNQLLESYGYQVDIYYKNDLPDSIINKFVHRSFPQIEEYFLLPGLIAAQLSSYDLVFTNGVVGGQLRTGETRVYNVAHGILAAGFNTLKKQDKVSRCHLTLRLSLFLERLSKKNKAGIIAVSNLVREELIRYYNVDSMVINNGVDLNHFRQSKDFRAKRKSYGIADDEIVGIYAGRWDPVQKRVQFLLDVIRERTDIKWVIATDTKIDMSEFDNVVLINGAGYDEMPQIYSMADFALQLSLYEGFSYFAVESIACSLPLISTRVGVADGIYTDPELRKLRIESWHHDPSFMDEVNSKISFLKDNPDFRYSFAKRSRELAKQKFSLEIWRKTMAEYLDLPGKRGA